MKRLCSAFVTVIAVQLLSASGVFADPRMETSNNFCHFILDPINTDNEVFMAGCGSAITVVEVEAVPGDSQATCEEDYVASGHALATRLLPAEVSPVPPGETLVLTSDDSEAYCAMVESNGREYRSYDWQTTIAAGEANSRGYVRVHYNLVCRQNTP